MKNILTKQEKERLSNKTVFYTEKIIVSCRYSTKRSFTAGKAIITISKPHSSQMVATTISESAANRFFIQPAPAPRPKKPPEAIHMRARVC